MKKGILFIWIIMLVSSVYSQYSDSSFNMPTSNQLILNINQNYENDTSFVLNIDNALYGLTVSGRCTLNTNKSMVRVLLSDDCNNEHLIYENYFLLADSNICNFSNIGIETSILDSIVPIKIMVQITDAELYISNISYTIDRHGISHSQIQARRNVQNNAIVTQLNNNLRKRNMTWRAGVTFISSLSYEEKKTIFGTDTLPNLYGIEYYKGGIYVSPDYEYSTQEKSSSPYVDYFDWRNRHGKNWITSVKSQGKCGNCWAMAAVDQVESYINLYYNQILNYDLSEQEIISACDSFPYISIRNYGCNGGHEWLALKYIKEFGIVNEECLPFQDFNYDKKTIVYGRNYSLPINSMVSYTTKCDNPNEIIKIANYKTHQYAYTKDSLKSYVLNGPYTVSYYKWGHVMLLIGYKTILSGDSVCVDGYTSNIITAPNELNGSVAFIIKNCWGEDWGENGYGYLCVNSMSLTDYYYADGKISSLILSDKDIVCSDNDGDGYYFWGLGNRPPNLPEWVPKQSDGDDSNAQYGPMDSYGHLMSLNPDDKDTIFITEPTDWDSESYIWQHLVVKSGAVLNISSNIKFYRGVNILIENDGKLNIDGGKLENVNIEVSSGGSLQLKNKGIIKKYKNFYASDGAIVKVENGVIN